MSEGQQHLLFPSFEIGVSVNGHFSDFTLNHSAYAELVQAEDDIDPFNFVEVWTYLDQHIHRYLMDVVQHVGPIDTDGVRLISLSIHILAGPSDVEDVLDCEDCAEIYQEQLAEYFTGMQSSEDEEDE